MAHNARVYTFHMCGVLDFPFQIALKEYINIFAQSRAVFFFNTQLKGYARAALEMYIC